jgi:hypothetical protein
MGAATEDTCPTLYLRERTSEGRTVFRAKSPVAFNPHPELNLVIGLRTGPLTCDGKAGFDLRPDFAETVVGWERAGDHTFQVFQAIASPDEGPIHLVHSNTLRLRFGEAAAIPRKWGPQVSCGCNPRQRHVRGQ